MERFKTILRRTSQLIFLLTFVILFIKTDYNGTDSLPGSVNTVFKINPLTTLITTISNRTFISNLWPAIFILFSTIFLGRWFCGWLCPMGTILDFIHRFTRGRQTAPGNARRFIRFFLLITLIISAVTGMSLVGLLDPFALLLRGLTLSLYPGFNYIFDSFFTLTYQHAPGFVNSLTEPIYYGLKQTILPFQQTVFKWSLLSGILLLLVLLLEYWERRGFCRNICPLGALFSTVSRWGLLNGNGGDEHCGNCHLCQSICRMGAIDQDRKINMVDCNLCMECVDRCPKTKIHFNWHLKSKMTDTGTAFHISRRQFLTATGAGILLPSLNAVDSHYHHENPLLLRPPGALPEPEFLDRCIRCGECMKVCIGNALHPTFLEAGLHGMFSPILVPRLGFCEYNCTLCGQVCPTGAIQQLNLEDKQTFVIGNAVFDTERCLPYRGVNCMVCEEHCPVPDKAIRFESVKMTMRSGDIRWIKRPYVQTDKCIGCGICEHVCPLPDAAAIHVRYYGESRNIEHRDPGSGDAVIQSETAPEESLEVSPAGLNEYGYQSETSGNQEGQYSEGFQLDQLEVNNDTGTFRETR